MDFDSNFPKRNHPDIAETLDKNSRATEDERFLRVIQGGTRWKCEERLHPTLEAWSETMGPAYIPNSKPRLKALHSAARVIVEEVGEEVGAEFVRFATARMKQARLDIAGLQSLHWLLSEFRASYSPGHEDWERRRYLKGVLVEDDEDDAHARREQEAQIMAEDPAMVWIERDVPNGEPGHYEAEDDRPIPF